MTGYKKKPFLIIIFSLIYLLNPIGNLLMIFISNTAKSPLAHFITIGKYIMTGDMLVISTIVLWIATFPLAYGLYKVRSWGWYYFLIHSVLIIFNSMIVRTTGGFTLSITPYFFVNLLALIPIGFFIRKEIRTPYLNPRVRWWEQAKRINHNIKVMVNQKEYSTYDISQTGVFILMSDTSEHPNINDKVEIKLMLDSASVTCNSLVVWNKIKADEHIPAGIGVKFIKMNRNDKKTVSNFIITLISEGKKINR